MNEMEKLRRKRDRLQAKLNHAQQKVDEKQREMVKAAALMKKWMRVVGYYYRELDKLRNEKPVAKGGRLIASHGEEV